MRSLLFGLFFSVPFFTVSSSSAVKPALILNNPLAMTITQTLALPKTDRSSRDKVKVLPMRDKVFLFESDGNLKFTYQLQKNKRAPLVFIIPGTGGTSEASGALFLAELLHQQGYHTVTVDDAFSWTFAVAGSRSGLPGYTPRDAEDLYAALQKVTSKLVADKKVKPRSYSLVGYSLGGLQSIFMHRLDERSRKFNFRKLLLIDPPLDLMHAVTRLDQIFEEGDSLSRGRKLTVFNRVLDVGGKYINSDQDFSNPLFLQSAFEELGFNNKDLAYLIGGSFRDSLRDVIFTSQQVRDLGILKSPVSRYRRNQRYDEARGISFQTYMNRFVYPSIKKQKPENYSLDDLNEEVSFYQFGDYVQTRQNIFIVHSVDDFILKNGDIEWIQDKFNDRALIFPIGGHCGAMNFPEFAAHLKIVFAK